MTYEGWGAIYDEFVSPDQCKEADGTQVTDSTTVSVVFRISYIKGPFCLFVGNRLENGKI